MSLSKEEIANLSSLLLSKEDTNTALAFELIQEPAIAQELITELFAVYKLAEEEELKQTAKAKIESVANPATIALLSSGKRLSRSAHYDPNEKTIAKNISYYVSGSKEELQGVKLALALVKKYGHGYEYLFNNLSSAELIAFFQDFKQGKIFRFSKKGVGKLPKEIFLIEGVEEIEEFDVSGNKLGTLPASIAKLKNLKKLVVSSNNIKSINKAIIKLQKLVYLDINDNKFKEFPMILTQCPALVELSALYSFSYFSRAYVLPKEIAHITTLKTFHYTEHCHHQEFMQVIQNLTHLEKLVVSHSKEMEQALPLLQKTLPNCAVSLSNQLFSLNYN
ncbi:MAG: leucine-rich repeat domain-containing protein [Aureispira sp.]